MQTNYKKKPLKQFIQIALRIITESSNSIDFGDHVAFAREYDIPIEILEKGKNFTRNFVNSDTNPDGSMDLFVFSSSNENENDITGADVTEFKENLTKLESFEDFKDKAFLIWKITFPQRLIDWKEATCSCPSFDTFYICKHIIGLLQFLGLADQFEVFKPLDRIENAEANYDNEPLFQTKRGRPSKASAALAMD